MSAGANSVETRQAYTLRTLALFLVGGSGWTTCAKLHSLGKRLQAVLLVCSIESEEVLAKMAAVVVSLAEVQRKLSEYRQASCFRTINDGETAGPGVQMPAAEAWLALFRSLCGQTPEFCGN